MFKSSKLYFLLFILISSITFSQSKKVWIELADDAYDRHDYATAAVFYSKVLDDTTVLRSYVLPYEAQLVNLKMKSLFKVPELKVTHRKDSTNIVKESILPGTSKFDFIMYRLAQSYRQNFDYYHAVEQFKKCVEKNIYDNLQISQLDIGPVLAKGCSAVVYSASLKEQITSEIKVPTEQIDLSLYEQPPSSPIQNVNRFANNFGSSLDNLHQLSYSPRQSISGSSFQTFVNRPKDDNNLKTNKKKKTVQFNDNLNIRTLSRSSILSTDYESQPFVAVTDAESNIEHYPFALKMMFNYDIQSNAMAILRAMHKETVPARRRHNVDADNWEKM